MHYEKKGILLFFKNKPKKILRKKSKKKGATEIEIPIKIEKLQNIKEKGLRSKTSWKQLQSGDVVFEYYVSKKNIVNWRETDDIIFVEFYN